MTLADSPLRDRLLLLVGSRRSGTFWLHRVLSAHPQVAAVPGETYLFADGIKPLVDRFHHGVGSSPATGFIYMDRAGLISGLRTFCDEVFTGLLDVLHDHDARYILERTPWHVEHLPLIGEIYPDMRVIHIIRDGRDVARSLVSMRWGPASVAEAAEEWRSAVEKGLEDGPKLEHYTEVRYEDLLADPAGGSRRLFDWLGLEISDHDLMEVVKEAQRVANVDKSAPTVGSGKWRSTWSAEDLAQFERVAGPLMARLGYEVTGAATGLQPRPQDSAPNTLETATARSRALVRRALGRTRVPRAPEVPRWKREAKSEMTKLMLDNVVGLVNQQQYEALEPLFETDAAVRVVYPDTEWESHGSLGRARLVEAFRSDEPNRAKQVRGEFYVDGSTWVGLVTYLGDDGGRHHRLFVVIVGRELIRSVAYHVL